MTSSTNAMGRAGNSKDVVVTATPDRITAGGVVVVTADLPDVDGTYDVEWTVEGPVELSEEETRVVLLGATTVTGDQVTLSSDDEPMRIRATLDSSPLTIGAWQVAVRLIPSGDGVIEDDGDDDDNGDGDNGDNGDGPRDDAGVLEGVSNHFAVTPRPFAAGDDVAVTLKRTSVPPTADQALWVRIRNSTNALSFHNYSRFIEAVMCDEGDFELGRREGRRLGHKLRKAKRRTGLPFPHVDQYRLLKAATEVFLMTHCDVDIGDFSNVDLDDEGRRLGRSLDHGDLEEQLRDQLSRVPAGEGEFLDVLPYFGLIRRQLGEVPVVVSDNDDDAAQVCYGILSEKLARPCFLELIHEYWCDEAGVPATLRAVTRRFQNRSLRGRDPLSSMNIDPLRPVNNLLWGVIQDEQHRLSTKRRAEEYLQEYGLPLSSRSGRAARVAEKRSRFMQAFHRLVTLCAQFYEQDDNTTVIADGFGVLNALKETHLLLTEGAHNQYGDLPWTARHEMLMYQWILSRPEMREVLPTRTMVVYPEPWIGRIDAMNKLQGWSDVPSLHFRDLAAFGEQLLLSIRFGAWTEVIEADRAGNWARYWRPEIQGYVHAYGAVTGVDLTRRGQWAAGPHQRDRGRDRAYRR